MVAFYKHDIAGWRGGTVMLSDRAYRVYHVIVEEIMLNEGPIVLHARSLAGKANRSVRDFNAALDELTQAGKLEVRGGFIDNSRCETELRSIRDNRETAANGGRKSGETRRKTNEINEATEAPLQNDANIREIEKEVEKKEISKPSVSRPKRVRTEYPDDFEKWWSDFPTDPLMSKKEAWLQWAKLGLEDRATAQRAVEPFKAHIAKQPDYRPVHACRFLSQRRFDGFAQKSPSLPEGVPQFETQEEFDAWWANRKGAAA